MAIRKLLTSKIVIKFNIIQLVPKISSYFCYMASTILEHVSQKIT